MKSQEETTFFVATLLHEQGTTGVQAHFNTFNRYLHRFGNPAVVVTPFSAPKSVVYPIFAVRRLIDPMCGVLSVWWYRSWHAFFLKTALRKKLSGTAKAVIYAQCPLSARVALDVRSSQDQRVIMVVHFNRSQADEWSEKGKISSAGLMACKIRSLEERTLAALDGIVYVSRFMQSLLEQRIPALRGIPKAVIPNCCDPIVAAEGAAEPVDIINVGTLEPRKNQQFLLRVLAEAAQRGRRYSLAFVGDGPDRSALAALAQKLGVAAQVRFLGYQKNAPQLMLAAKLYAHCATVENLPMAVIEAMACGLPVLAPPVGGIPELFIEGEQGFFWDMDDEVSAAKLMIGVLDNPEMMRKLGASARMRFIDHFSTSRVAHQLVKFLLAAQLRRARVSDSSQLLGLICTHS